MLELRRARNSSCDMPGGALAQFAECVDADRVVLAVGVEREYGGRRVRDPHAAQVGHVPVAPSPASSAAWRIAWIAASETCCCWIAGSAGPG